jgi:hypothetical protein
VEEVHGVLDLGDEGVDPRFADPDVEAGRTALGSSGNTRDLRLAAMEDGGGGERAVLHEAVHVERRPDGSKDAARS